MNNKTMAIVALCLAILCLTIGFTAFSSTLKINSGANVKPDSNTFNVDFSSSESSIETNPITPTLNPITLTAENGIINNTGNPTISGLSVEFKEPGQKATYTFYARNIGEYTAFLKSINYLNVAGKNSPRVCTALGDTNDTLVQAACDDITLSVKVGNEEMVTGTNGNINNHNLNVGMSEKIIVEIEYAVDGDTADGQFSVQFGDISLNYNSVD